MKTLQASLSSLIVEFHKLYAQFKRPEYLEIAGTLGKVKGADFQELWERKLKEGRETGDNSPLPTTKDVR